MTQLGPSALKLTTKWELQAAQKLSASNNLKVYLDATLTDA
jgi:hypothetical protein